MENDAVFKKLLFNQKWIDLGIVTPESFAILKEQYLNSDDQYDEHYRWRAFTSFMDENDSLPTKTFFALYNLGDEDPDYSMGGAIMRSLLDRRDCPLEVLEMAMLSDRDFLVKAANRELMRRGEVPTL